MSPRLLGSAVLGVLLLPACTAVLGMDEAKLDDSVGAAAASGSGGAGGGGRGGTSGQTGQPLVECTTARSDCKTCLTNCGADVDACLQNADCRRALTKYGGCLESGCLDSTGNCSEALGGETSLQAQKIAECLTFQCSNNGACVGTTVISKCERYCACMQQHCSTDFTWTDAEACMNDCALLDQRVQDCRGDHCEYGAIHHDHCIHAKGESADDVNNPCRSTPPASRCLVKSDVKGPCQTSADCCPGLTCFNKECGD